MEPLSDDIEENMDRFIVEAIATGCVWGLESSDGWAICPSEKYKETDVMPFWSQPEFAQQHCEGDWSIYQPVAVALDEFMEEWLPGMHEDVILLGINWNAELEGPEIEPLDLLSDIEDELS